MLQCTFKSHYSLFYYTFEGLTRARGKERGRVSSVGEGSKRERGCLSTGSGIVPLHITGQLLRVSAVLCGL